MEQQDETVDMVAVLLCIPVFTPESYYHSRYEQGAKKRKFSFTQQRLKVALMRGTRLVQGSS
jgi:hypothetical protein